MAVLSQQGCTWKGLIPGPPGAAKAIVAHQTLVRVLRGDSLMGQKASKVLYAHFMVLGSHAHVGVPDEVHIYRRDAEDLRAHLSELKKLVVAGDDVLQLSTKDEQRHHRSCQAVQASC